MDKAEIRLHEEMEKVLTPRMFFIYQMFFVQNYSDEKVAEILRYKTSEKSRKPGYKQIQNLKNRFKILAIRIMNEKDIFYN
jgi:hypothetical protein